MLWLPLSLFTFSAALKGVSAQSDASCLPFYNWTFNSHDQSPCQVASSLLSICNNGPFPVNALSPNSHYIGPTLQTANPCQCNTVTYSLMSACGACQGRTYLSWSVWSANCAIVSINTFPEPIPSGVAIPGWAYLDVKGDDNFDQSNAIDNTNLTESTAIPSPTSTILRTTTSPLRTSSTQTKTSSGLVVSTNPTPSPTSTSPSSDSISPETLKRDNAIGGGIVGGFAGLVIFAALFFWYIKRRKRLARNGQQLPSPSPSPADPENPSWHDGPYMRQTGLSVAAASPTGSRNSSFSPPPKPLHHDASSELDDSVPLGHAH